MTHITTDVEEDPVRKLVTQLGAEGTFSQIFVISRLNRSLDVNVASGYELYAPGVYVIFINGTAYGISRYPSTFVKNFRRLRRTGRISEFVSIYVNHHHNGVHIATDGGRICRPLIIVDKRKSKVLTRHIKVSHQRYIHVIADVRLSAL